MLAWCFLLESTPAQYYENENRDTPPLRIASWNISWLGDGENDLNPRTDEDIQRLRQYAHRLDSDVIALQEIENEMAAYSIFDENEWEVFLSSKNSWQHTGFAVRKSFFDTVDIQQKVDPEALHTPYGLRYGTDIKITYPDNTEIRLLSIHLKSSCFDEIDLSESSKDWDATACQKLGHQTQPLREWTNMRLEENTPFAILGDWNRRININEDMFWDELTNDLNGELHRTGNINRISNCWSRQYPNPVDHIVIGGGLEEIPGSFIEKTYNEKDVRFKENLSDHCPISVKIMAIQPQ